MGSEIIVVGLSWQTAPVAVRERLAFRDDELPAALNDLMSSASVAEALILSTCNRVEVYATTMAGIDSPVETSIAEVRSFLIESRGVSRRTVAGKLYDRHGDAAVEHVFRVSAALDSMVLGEAQILGQLKAAFNITQRTGATGQILGRCMERAFGVAKRVRTETGVSLGAANVSTVAVDLARRVFGDLEGKQVLVVGAGKMSAVAVRHLRAHGAGEILVTNRSPEKAHMLADEVDGVARPWAALDDLLTIADVVISSTAAQSPLLTKRRMKKVVKRRRYQSLVVIDIAVPRDAEPSIGNLDGLYLFDIDDLEKVVTANLKERASEARGAERIVEAEVSQFRKWQRSQRAVPTIRSLRHHFRSVARAEVDKAIAHINDDKTAEQHEEAIRRLGNIIVNKLLHVPMTALKSGDEEEMEVLVSATQRLFDLPDDDQDDGDQVPGATRAAAATDLGAGSSATEGRAGKARETDSP